MSLFDGAFPPGFIRGDPAAYISESPQPYNFNGMPGWWSVPQQWFMVTVDGQIWVSPCPFLEPVVPVLSGEAEYSDPDLFFTFTTTEPHGLSTGMVVTISGATAHPVFNG